MPKKYGNAVKEAKSISILYAE